jgi:hypothetical protein
MKTNEIPGEKLDCIIESFKFPALNSSSTFSGASAMRTTADKGQKLLV